MQPAHSLYIHIPFCVHRCAYCDFNTYAGYEHLIPAYVQALCQEIEMVGQISREPITVKTIFWGGGTPSLLPAELLIQTIESCRKAFIVVPDAEISLEANPGTVDGGWLKQVRNSGVNRISFGIQSMHPTDLVLLERQHNPLDTIRAVHWARSAGFENISLDLIFGIPGQTLARWESTLETTLSLQPEHLSLYGLTIEHGTPFLRWVEKGLVAMPDDDLAADMYDLACERLEKTGFDHYEISNWARNHVQDRYECKHNLQYWLNLPYLGFGAGAHGYSTGKRTVNVRGIRAYIERMNRSTSKVEFPASKAAEQVTFIDRWTEMQETMMTGLRLLNTGVSRQRFEERFGVSLEQVFNPQINSLIQDGLLEWGGDTRDRLRLTTRGWLLGNRVFRQFVGLEENPLESTKKG